jgi:phosphate transport system substrate-binding protein
MRLHNRIFGLCLSTAVLIQLCNAGSADTLRIGGTGAVSAVLPIIFAAMPPHENLSVEVVPSLGTSGGLQALAEGVIDIAVAARPLKPEEKARGLTPALTLRTPFVLVTSYGRPDGFKSTEIADIYKSPNAKWPNGSLIRIILRPRSETDTALMGAMFPGTAAAIETARRRPDIPIAATDQDNLTLAERLPGSLAGSSLAQMLAEQRSLRLIPIDGVTPSLTALESGAYPFGKALYFVVPTTKKKGTERFIAFINSPRGQQVLRATGSLLVADQAVR